MEATADIMDGRLLAARRPEGLSDLFERHHATLFAFFVRMTGHRSLSEDLTQEVFLRILRYGHTFEGGQPFKPWMFRIARRVHLDHLARQRPHVALEELLEEPPAPRACPHARAVEAQDQVRLEAALARLSLRKRELLLLSRDPDLSHRDLADLLGCSPGSVKVQVHRALKELRTLFLEGGAP